MSNFLAVFVFYYVLVSWLIQAALLLLFTTSVRRFGNFEIYLSLLTWSGVAEPPSIEALKSEPLILRTYFFPSFFFVLWREPRIEMFVLVLSSAPIYLYLVVRRSMSAHEGSSRSSSSSCLKLMCGPASLSLTSSDHTEAKILMIRVERNSAWIGINS